MAMWLTTGTINVTNGSTTVTGVGTTFSQAKPGSELMLRTSATGPVTGPPYEITAIASDLSMTIFPAYGATTATGQAYAIRPVTFSMEKDLIDRVDQLLTKIDGLMFVAGNDKILNLDKPVISGNAVSRYKTTGVDKWRHGTIGNDNWRLQRWTGSTWEDALSLPASGPIPPLGGGSVLIADAPPTAADNSLWWESDTGKLFIRYNDGTSAQWVVVSDLTVLNGGASTGEAYVTIGNTAGLSQERALTAGAGITITDDGAVPSAKVTVAATGAAADGSQTAPSITFALDNNNGLYRIGADDWALTTGGVKQVELSSATGVTISSVLNCPAQPGFSAHKNNILQSGIGSGVFTKVTLPTEVYDVGPYFDTTLSRWKPPAGKVLITGAIYWSLGATTGGLFIVSIYKNGVRYKDALTWAGSTGEVAANLTIVDSCDGINDYYELIGYGVSGTSLTINGNPNLTYFTGMLL